MLRIFVQSELWAGSAEVRAGSSVPAINFSFGFGQVNVAVCFLWYVSICVESVRSKNVHGDPVMLGSRPSLFGIRAGSDQVILSKTSRRTMSNIDIAMCGGFNFQELHKGYWGVIRLLRVFNDFMLKWRMRVWMVVWGVVSEFDFFLQQKLIIIVLELQLCDYGWEVCRRLRLK